MGIRLGDVFVAIRANTDQLQQDLNSAKGNVTNWASGLAGSIKGLVGGAALAGVGALSASVVGIGTAAFNASSEFDAAQKKMQAAMGTSDQIAKEYGQTVKDIFANNFGASIEDVATSITKVNEAFQRIGGADSQGEIQKATEAALALRDTFQVEVNESTNAAVELMDKFGLSAEQAFDFIAYGFQNGLNSSDDFLDTIGEYSTQFANGGATAEQFFSIISTGMAGGMLGTDKAADAFKEFRLRIQDGSQTTADGLALLGLNAEKLNKDLSTGTISVADAFDIVLDRLREIEDPTIRMQAGAAVIGTQFEDLGDSVVRNMDASGIAIEKVNGSIQSLNKQYATIPSFFEGLKRRAIVAITPIGDAILGVFNASLPLIENWFTSVETWITEFLANSNFEWGPDIKQIKLGDLFEWVKSDGLGVTRLKLADFFDLTWSSTGITKLTLGDVFSFSAGEGTTINLADYLRFVYDAESGAVALTLGDVFTFVSDEGGTVINLGDYIKFKYDTETGKVTLNWSDVFTFVGLDGETHTIDLTDFVTFTYDTKSGGVALTLADVFSFVKTDKITTINLKDYVKFTWGGGEEGGEVKKLTLGDFFDFSNKDGVGIAKFDLKEFLWAGWDETKGPFTLDQLFDFSTKPLVAGYSLSDFFTWLSGDEVEKTTPDDIFDMASPPTITKFTLPDFFGWMGADQVKITYDDLFNFSTDSATGITKLTIGDLFEFSSGEDGTKLTWGDIFNFSSDETGITKLTIDDLISFTVDEKGNIASPDFEWSEFITKLVWGDMIPNLTWVDWLVKILWADYVPGMTWSDYLDKVVWGDFVKSISWSDFVPDIDWASFVPKITWPLSISNFSWRSFITGINLSTLVPAFPGWTTLFQQLNPWGDAPPPTSSGSSGSFGGGGGSGGFGGRSLVTIENVNVGSREDAEALAYGIAKRLAYR